MNSRFLCLGLVMFSFLSAHAESSSLHVVGSSTLGPMIVEMGQLFDQEHGVRVTVDISGSKQGLTCAIDHSCDLGLSSEGVPKEDLAKVSFRHLGWDAVAFVAHKGVPIENLTTAQLKSVLSGQAKTWRDVGGTSAEAIAVFQRDEKRGSRELLRKQLGIEFVGPEAGPNSEVMNRLQRIPNSISYTSLGLARSNPDKVKVLSIDGVAPTNANIDTGKYPWRKELVLVIPKLESKVAGDFVSFVMDKKSSYLKKYEFLDQ